MSGFAPRGPLHLIMALLIVPLLQGLYSVNEAAWAPLSSTWGVTFKGLSHYNLYFLILPLSSSKYEIEFFSSDNKFMDIISNSKYKRKVLKIIIHNVR